MFKEIDKKDFLKYKKQAYLLSSKWWGEVSPFKVDEDSIEMWMDFPNTRLWKNEEDELCGYYVLVKSPHPFAKATSASILSIVIDEKYRGSMLFYKMWKKIKEDTEDCDELCISSGNNTHLDFLKKLGFKETGITYRRLNNGC